MKENVSDFLVRRLSEWGVKRIFGYPGDGINGVFGARALEHFQFVCTDYRGRGEFIRPGFCTQGE